MDIKDFCAALFLAAENEGFKEYEAYYVSGEQFHVNILEGEVDKYSVNTYSGLSFRVKQGKQISYVSTTALDPQEIPVLISTIKDNFKVLQSTDEQFIYSGQGEYPQVATYNPELSRVSIQDKIALAKQLEKEALAFDERIVRVRSAVVSSGEGMVYMQNSNGISLTKKDNYIFSYVMPIAQQGDEMNSAVAYICTRNFDDINPAALAKRSCEEAISLLSAKSVDTGKYKTIIRSDAMCELLDTFWTVFSADEVQKGVSLFAGKVGQTVASPNLTIIDDPLLASALGAYPFDDEGYPASTKTLIDKGELKGYLHNLKTAAKANTTSTGNGSKASYSSAISIAPSNLYIQPGPLSFDDLLAKMENGIVITELNGLHSGANSATGDFSLDAKGYLVENGKIVRGVNQVTVSGNYYQLLKDVEDMGSDLMWGFPSNGVCGSPSILIKSLDFAGIK